MNRRALLSAAPLALAAAAVPAIAEALPEAVAPDLDRDLIELGENFAQVEARYHAAVAAYDAALAAWSPHWPALPDSCIAGSGDLERGITGAAIIRPGQNHALRCLTEAEIAHWRGHWQDCMARDESRKRKAPKDVRDHWAAEVARLDHAVHDLPIYKARCAEILEKSGFKALAAARSAAIEDVFSCLRAILCVKNRTAHGLVTKARAAAALHRLTTHDRYLGALLDQSSFGTNHLAAMLGTAVVDHFTDVGAMPVRQWKCDPKWA